MGRGAADTTSQPIVSLASVLGFYLLLSAAYTWPLLANLGSRLPSDGGNPVLNASILEWNATTIPFSRTWWNAPHYFPADSVAAFTENLQGVSAIATPVYWLTGSTIAAYNSAYFLSWPLSAFAVYLLVEFLSQRRDAALIAGLVFAFTPYRTTELAHIQSLSAYWFPIALVGMHGYLQQAKTIHGHENAHSGKTRRWLALFALAWLLQSLCNGHYLLFGAVVIGCWLVYFCGTNHTWRAGATLLGVWIVASVPLVPILLHYSGVHGRYGLKRSLNEILAYSARPHSWFEVSGDVWFWRHWLPQGRDDLFPGVTAVACVVVAASMLLWRGRERVALSSRVRVLRGALTTTGALAAAAVVVGLSIGPWTTTLAGITIRMSDLNRGLAAMGLCATALIAITPVARHALVRRSPFVFYTAMTVVIAVFCFGPVLHVGEAAMLSPAPYRALMALPGFDELRVPSRFWMLGIMCLAVAAGLAYRTLIPSRPLSRSPIFVAMSACALLDGWMPTMRMVRPPVTTALESANGRAPVLELPIGPDWDWDATYRASAHHRRIFNGVSGYDPPHYDALRIGLNALDPAMLSALASLGPLDVVVNGDADPDGAIAHYVAATSGAQRLSQDGPRTLYRIPQGPAEPPLGKALPVSRVETRRFGDINRITPVVEQTEDDVTELHDGRLDSGWSDYPQSPGQWLQVDLGKTRTVAGVTHTLGRSFLAFPRRIEIQMSMDGQTWERVWGGPAASHAFLALVREPLIGAMRFSFPARDGRYVRLLQLDDVPREWHVAEIQVNGPY